MASSNADNGPYRIGKSAMENTELVLRSDGQDVWFHINGVPSAHLIYYNPDKVTLEALRKSGTIYRMAAILKKNSKYKKATNIEVIYDYIRNVQVLPKPGLVQVNNPKKILV